MLIGHNPGIQYLALELATTGPALAALREKFPTGALATVEIEVERWRDVTDGKATATGLVTPRSLETGAGGCVMRGQPKAIPSAEADGVISGRRIMRNELNNPTRPARIGTSSAT